MVKKLYLLAVIILISTIMLITCGKDEKLETGEITTQEGVQEESTVETIKPQAINYDSMFVIISELAAAVKQQPTDIEVRRQLVAACYDTTWETILAAGFGEPSQKASTESVAAKFAEQAAAADAYRWAAYIKKWHKDPTTPDVGSLATEIQGGRVVAKKHLPDYRVSVLVEVRVSNIQYKIFRTEKEPESDYPL